MHFIKATVIQNHANRPKCEFMASSPDGPGIILDTSKEFKNIIEDRKIAAAGVHLQQVWGALDGRMESTSKNIEYLLRMMTLDMI